MVEQARQIEARPAKEVLMERFLGARTAVADIYEKVVALGNDAREKVSGSARVKTELLHQVEHSLLRIETFHEGGFTQYSYEKIRPDWKEAKKELTAKELVQRYKDCTKKLEALFSEPELEQKTFIQPGEKHINGITFLENILAHEEYHLGKLSIVEAYLGLGRTDSLNKHWGEPLEDPPLKKSWRFPFLARRRFGKDPR